MTMAVKVTTIGYRQIDPVNPRLAEPDELNDVMAMCKALHRENGQFPLNEEKLRERMEAAVNRKWGMVGVIGHHHKIEALIFMTIAQFWYTDENHLEELFSYVSPQHRKTTHAKRLVEWAKETADTLGMKLLIGIISTIKTEAKVRLYRRQLGAPIGAYFLYGFNRQTAGNNTEH